MTIGHTNGTNNRIRPVEVSESGPTTPENLSIENNTQRLHYRVNDIPEWKQTILLGFQQTMICFSGCLVAPYLVSEIACAGTATIALRARLISSAFVVTGLTTLLQCTVGLRLAVLQGPSFAFLPPLFAFGSLPEMKCNSSSFAFVPEEVYLEKIRTIQGSLALSALLLVFLGALGLIGFISRFIGPITICPLLILLCVGNVHVIVEKAEMHWISIIQFGLLLMFALYLAEVTVPIPYYSERRIKYTKYRLFGQFPYLISIIICYIIASFMSRLDLIEPESPARTDKKQALMILENSPWFQIPYPGQFGLPGISIGLFLGMLASCVTCAVESLGGYGILAKISEEKPPPISTLNRAIVIEGLGCCLGGLMGIGVGVTTYSENIAAVSITRVASRFIMQITGCIFICIGIFTKIAAVLATIPDPMVGGVLGMGICMICGVAFRNLEFVNVKLSRNLTIMGLAVILGSAIPDFFEKYPINTGIMEIDQMFNILLTIKMFVGGFIAFVLDNTCGGATREERGFHKSSKNFNNEENCTHDGYAFPEKINNFAPQGSFGSKDYQNFEDELYTFGEFLEFTDRPVLTERIDEFHSIGLDSPRRQSSNQPGTQNEPTSEESEAPNLPTQVNSTSVPGNIPSGNLSVADFSRPEVVEPSPIPTNLGSSTVPRDSGNENMGIMQMICCLKPQSRSHHYHAPSETAVPTAPNRPTQYSWDANRVDPKDYTLSSRINEVVIKKTNEINGQQFVIENCKDSIVIVLDHSGAITVDDCDDCLFVFGPCSGSIFIRNCKNCFCYSISKQFRVRDSNIFVHLFSSTPPVIEESKVDFFPLYMNYDNLDDHMVAAKLSPYYNSWSNVYDFTPDKQTINYRITQNPPETEVEDKLGLIASAYQLNFSRENSFFIHPIPEKTLKNGDEIALVLHKQEDSGKDEKSFFSQSKNFILEVLKDKSVNLTNITDIVVQKGDLQTVLPVKMGSRLSGHIAILEFQGKTCRRHVNAVVAEFNKSGPNSKAVVFELIQTESKENIYRFADMKHSV